MFQLTQSICFETKHGAHRTQQVTDGAHVSMSIPGCPHYIEDQPGFVHRGVLLDVSRQWYSVPWTLVLEKLCFNNLLVLNDVVCYLNFVLCKTCFLKLVTQL